MNEVTTNVSGRILEMAKVVRFIPKSKFHGLSLLPGERIVAGHFDCHDQDYAPLVAVVQDIPVSEAVPDGVAGVLPVKKAGGAIGSFVLGDGYNTRTVLVRKPH